MTYVKKFLKGTWLNKAKEYINNQEKIKDLLEKLLSLVKKDGLAKVKDTLILMYNYLKDVSSGRYKDYNSYSLILIIAALIYVVSPVDLIPDFLLGGGFVDDVVIVSWAMNEAKNELFKYKIWRESK